MTASEPFQREPDVSRAKLGGEWAAIRALYGMCGRRRQLLAVIVSLAVLAFLLEGIGIGLLIPLFETLSASQDRARASGPFADAMISFTDRLPDEHRLAVLAAIVFGLVLLKTAVIYAHHVIAVWLSGYVGLELRQRLLRRALALSAMAMEKLGIGRLHNTIDAQVWHVTDGLDTVTQALASAAAAIVFVALLLLISVPLTLAVIVGAVAVSLIMLAVRRGAHYFGRRSVAANADLSSRIVETLTHHRLVRAFGTEAYEIDRFRAAADALRRAVLRTELLRGVVTPATELLYVPLMFGVIVIGLSQDHGVATLLAYLLLLYRLVPHLRNLDHSRVELAAIAGPIEDVVTVLALPEDLTLKSGRRRIRKVERGIDLEDVTFRYEPGQAAGVAGLSFSIPKGSVVALVGPSGAGKSTIVSLLYRFFDPTCGRIVVDGIPLPEIDLASWRQKLALAGQDIELMSGTVEENIRYGHLSATHAQVMEAARLANAEEFIAALPNGYRSMVGARGLSLSGGQRQRVTLARALLRRPDLLILDEATNALDAESEDVVLERLHAARSDMSMLVIAHRLRSVRHADHVILIYNGRIVETGPPAKLLRNAGAFRRLWEREGGELRSDPHQPSESAV